MLFPGLLLLLLVTVARSYRYSADRNPTCEQLREFWDEVNQMAQAVEITNEIPVLPLPVQNAVDRLLRPPSFRNTRRGKSHQTLLKDKSPRLLDITNSIFRYSVPEQPASSQNNFVLSKQQAPLNEELNGVFGEFLEQAADEQNMGSSKPRQPTRHTTKPEVIMIESSPGVSSGSKKNGEIDFFIPQWGLPEDVDTFGSFVDVDFSSSYHPMIRTPKGIQDHTSDISQVCENVMNTECRTKDDCFCKGWRKLTCIHGKCLSHGNQEDIEAKYGIWHDGPIPHSELQLSARRQKRSYKSIFM